MQKNPLIADKSHPLESHQTLTFVSLPSGLIILLLKMNQDADGRNEVSILIHANYDLNFLSGTNDQGIIVVEFVLELDSS